MQDNLKDFINQNREEMDAITPGQDLWNNIDNNLNYSPKNTTFSKAWFKGLLGFTGVVVIGTVLFFNNQNPEKQNSILPIKEDQYIAEEIDHDGVNIEETINSEDNQQLVKYQNQESEVDDFEIKEKNVITEVLHPVSEEEAENSLKESNKLNDYSEGSHNNSNEIWYSEYSKNLKVDTVFNNVESLKITSLFCDVKLRPNSGEHLEFKGTISLKEGEKGNDYRIVYKKSGTSLEIELEWKKRCVNESKYDEKYLN